MKFMMKFISHQGNAKESGNFKKLKSKHVSKKKNDKKM